MICSRPNCRNVQAARGLCEKHYRRIPKGWVDAAPIIAHYEALRSSGMSVYRIAEVAGVHRDTLYRMGRRSRTVQIETARKILAVPIPSRVIDGGAKYVDATGTRRRLQALMASGWPIRTLEVQLGRHDSALWNAMRTETVFASTAAAVADLFDHLQLTPGPSERSRRLAQSKGWHLPLAWDEDTIDDPNAQPDMGAYAPVTFAERYLELRELGERSEEAIAKRIWNSHHKTFGVSPHSVVDMRNRAGLKPPPIAEGYGPRDCAS